MNAEKKFNERVERYMSYGMDRDTAEWHARRVARQERKEAFDKMWGLTDYKPAIDLGFATKRGGTVKRRRS